MPVDDIWRCRRGIRCDDDGLAAATMTARCDCETILHLLGCGRKELVGPRGLATMRPSDVVVGVARGIVGDCICLFVSRAHALERRNYSAIRGAMQSEERSILARRKKRSRRRIFAGRSARLSLEDKGQLAFKKKRRRRVKFSDSVIQSQTLNFRRKLRGVGFPSFPPRPAGSTLRIRSLRKNRSLASNLSLNS